MQELIVLVLLAAFGALLAAGYRLIRYPEAGGELTAISHEAALPRLNVLVVDDSQADRELLGALLRRAGASVEAAESKDDALAKMSKRHFDLVLSDLVMPMGSGFELLKEIKRTSDVPVVAVTGESADAASVKDAGFRLLIRKPFDSAHLTDALVALPEVAAQVAENQQQDSDAG